MMFKWATKICPENTKAKANRILSPVCHFHRHHNRRIFYNGHIHRDCVSICSAKHFISMLCVCYTWLCTKMFFLLSFSIVIFTQFLMITFAHRNDMLLSVLNNLETVENEGTPFITIQRTLLILTTKCKNVHIYPSLIYTRRKLWCHIDRNRLITLVWSKCNVWLSQYARSDIRTFFAVRCNEKCHSIVCDSLAVAFLVPLLICVSDKNFWCFVEPNFSFLWKFFD